MFLPDDPVLSGRLRGILKLSGLNDSRWQIIREDDSQWGATLTLCNANNSSSHHKGIHCSRIKRGLGFEVEEQLVVFKHF